METSDPNYQGSTTISIDIGNWWNMFAVEDTTTTSTETTATSPTISTTTTATTSTTTATPTQRSIGKSGSSKAADCPQEKMAMKTLAAAIVVFYHL